MTDKTPADILEALGKPFPAAAIKKRQGGGNKMLDYIETHTVINRLNSATNGEWSFHVKDIQWRADLLMVLGELTIPGLGTRSGFGVQKVSDRGGEDLVKGASSDALKKCATLFGVALELYGADYEAATPAHAPVRPQDAPQRAQPANTGTGKGSTIASAEGVVIAQTRHVTAPVPPAPDKVKVMKALHATGKDAGFEHIDLHDLIVAKGHASMTDAPVDALVDLGKAIKADPGKLRAWLTKRRAEQAELLPSDADLAASSAAKYTN